jgi:hypothetical protein
MDGDNPSASSRDMAQAKNSLNAVRTVIPLTARAAYRNQTYPTFARRPSAVGKIQPYPPVANMAARVINMNLSSPGSGADRATSHDIAGW